MMRGELRLPQAGRAGAVEIVADHVAQLPERERLERGEHLYPCPVADIREHRQIAPHRRLVHDKGGRGYAVQVEMPKGTGITGLGFH